MWVQLLSARHLGHFKFTNSWRAHKINRQHSGIARREYPWSMCRESEHREENVGKYVLHLTVLHLSLFIYSTYYYVVLLILYIDIYIW